MTFTSFHIVKVSIAEYNPFTKAYVQTEDFNNKRVALNNSYIVLTGLTPGRCLSVILLAVSNTSVVLPRNYSNPLVHVTCGCPSLFLDELASTEPTGAPESLVLTQVCLS